jgi:hypothetical protein
MPLLQLTAAGRRLTAAGYLLKVPEVVAPGGPSGPNEPLILLCSVAAGDDEYLFGPYCTDELFEVSVSGLSTPVPDVEFELEGDGIWHNAADFNALVAALNPTEFVTDNGAEWQIRLTSPDGSAVSATITATYF